MSSHCGQTLFDIGGVSGVIDRREVDQGRLSGGLGTDRGDRWDGESVLLDGVEKYDIVAGLCCW